MTGQDRTAAVEIDTSRPHPARCDNDPIVPAHAAALLRSTDDGVIPGYGAVARKP
ncbi:hypothetical protein ABZ922_13730 [Streptomyces shenzhenensis]|uniref:hypothetical protein n=1 Tax=Streptomyces shenzhenensis TaxID=943815 RepID=UPI0033C3F820